MGGAVKRKKQPGGACGLQKARKGTNKDTNYEERKVQQWTARLEAKRKATAGEAATTEVAPAKRQKRCTSPGEAPERKTAAEEAEQRIVIAWTYRRLKSPPEDSWDGVDGTVAEIRRRLGLAESQRKTIRRTLVELKAGRDVSKITKRGGFKRRLDDKTAELGAELLRAGFGKRNAAQHLSEFLRRSGDTAGVSATCIGNLGREDGQFEMQKRKRRKRAAGNTDENSIWAKASLAQCLQAAARASARARFKAPPRRRSSRHQARADRVLG
mmetsp:Transcript_5851/g.15258  ORF Transcript_5851/g.15258 Transcript_5851/m.15258 type:complete len:270 (-) Transcript_5851:1443-2252(-)